VAVWFVQLGKAETDLVRFALFELGGLDLIRESASSPPMTLKVFFEESLPITSDRVTGIATIRRFACKVRYRAESFMKKDNIVRWPG